MPPSRRRFVRSAGTAVVAIAVPVARGTGDGDGSGDEEPEIYAESDSTPHPDASDELCQPSDELSGMDGFVMDSERYRKCTNFRISVALRRFWISVGRGPTPCRRPSREFVGYEISYVNDEAVGDAEVTDEEADDEEADVGGADDGAGQEYSTALLAVPTLGREDSGLPHEYYIPEQQFRFVSTDGGVRLSDGVFRTVRSGATRFVRARHLTETVGFHSDSLTSR